MLDYFAQAIAKIALYFISRAPNKTSLDKIISRLRLNYEKTSMSVSNGVVGTGAEPESSTDLSDLNLLYLKFISQTQYRR
jgi:hypothetical protein